MKAVKMVVFEVDRGAGWGTRTQGSIQCSVERLVKELCDYTIQYPHRLFVDGKLIATCEPVPGHPNAPKITRHDQTSGC